jgi:hypothetical protein
VIVWLLDHPEAESRAETSDERFTEKFGWVREFSEEIATWNECQNVISTGVRFMNEQASLPPRIFRSVTKELRSDMGETSSSLASEGQRFPISTEILESSFGLSAALG